MYRSVLWTLYNSASRRFLGDVIWNMISSSLRRPFPEMGRAMVFAFLCFTILNKNGIGSDHDPNLGGNAAFELVLALFNAHSLTFLLRMF